MAVLVKPKISIITCPQWGARKPRSPIKVVPQAKRVIFHHTAGHHPEIGTPEHESRQECIRYARDIQAFHMDNPERHWIDSGHNFLVCRNGLTLQGRWLTVSTIQAGHMVESAHCPGQNRNIGIEHEHSGTEKMTDAQRLSSATLMAWIAWQYELRVILPVDPHSAHYNTQCPVNLKSEIPRIENLAQDILEGKVKL